MKTLYDISWKTSEPEYRLDPALSYSTLAKYEREGFSALGHLGDKISTPSLTNGSAVDALITGGEEEFNEHFIVGDIPKIPDTIINVVKIVFESCSDNYSSLYNIDDKYIISATEATKYQPNWKPETRAKVIREKGESYYKLMYLAGNKTILTLDDYNTILNQVNVLKESNATKWYFQEDNPFEDTIRHYQLKFKATFNNVDYRCMSDLLVEIPSEKTIIPIDLKTSGKPEYLFYKSFLEWNYSIQGRLYWRIIRANMNKDEKYKEWKLENYKFIVVNKQTLNPLVWEFKETQETGTLYFGKSKQIELRDPFIIGEELRYYLDNNPQTPMGIEENNNLSEWLNKL